MNGHLESSISSEKFHSVREIIKGSSAFFLALGRGQQGLTLLFLSAFG